MTTKTNAQPNRKTRDFRLSRTFGLLLAELRRHRRAKQPRIPRNNPMQSESAE
jgi:hypothetical protein